MAKSQLLPQIKKSVMFHLGPVGIHLELMTAAAR